LFNEPSFSELLLVRLDKHFGVVDQFVKDRCFHCCDASHSIMALKGSSANIGLKLMLFFSFALNRMSDVVLIFD